MLDRVAEAKKADAPVRSEISEKCLPPPDPPRRGGSTGSEQWSALLSPILLVGVVVDTRTLSGRFSVRRLQRDRRQSRSLLVRPVRRPPGNRPLRRPTRCWISGLAVRFTCSTSFSANGVMVYLCRGDSAGPPEEPRPYEVPALSPASPSTRQTGAVTYASGRVSPWPSSTWGAARNVAEAERFTSPSWLS
jgi:hypothetical protein